MTTMRTRKELCAATLIAALIASGCASLDSRSSAGHARSPAARTAARRPAESRLPLARSTPALSPRAGEGNVARGAPRTSPAPPANNSAPGSVRLASHLDDQSPEVSPPDDSGHVTLAPDAPSGGIAAAKSQVLAIDAPAADSRPINLGTALQIADGQNPQVMFARERIQEAFAQWDKARVLWLPSLNAGAQYNKHEGPIQQVDGIVFNTSRNAIYTGFGAQVPGAASPVIPGLVARFHMADAIFQPQIAERATAARQQGAQAAANDTLLDAALAYLELLRAHQELAIAAEARDHTQKLTDLTTAYAESGKGARADEDRARTELSVRINDVQRGEESIEVASARLAQQLSLDAQIELAPQEPTIIPIELVPTGSRLADLVADGLTHRPEVCESRFLVAEAVQRLRREQYAPLIPSVLLGVSYGGFGGGLGSRVKDFGGRFDADAFAYWEVRNLGFGERAAQCEARSRLQQAQWREVAAMDRVAREVVEAHAQVESRRKQIAVAQHGIETAELSYRRNLERIENAEGLPLEVLQSIQALTQARREYLRTVISYNEAQFRLHRALGWPSSL